jgi:hypothetical protein
MNTAINERSAVRVRIGMQGQMPRIKASWHGASFSSIPQRLVANAPFLPFLL